MPFDASTYSEKAFSHALTLAKIHNSQVTLLHVIQDIPMFSILENTLASEDDMADLLAEHMRTVYTHSERYMVQMLNRKAISCRQEFGIDIVARVMIGSPVGKIIEFADANNVDLVVVGNAGLGSLSKIRALGSVSRGVAERASCPVLIVH